MAEQQKCRKLASVLVDHQDHFSELSDANCQWAIQNPKDAIALFVSAVANRSKAVTKKLFEFVGAKSLPAIGKFVVAEKLVVGKVVDGIKVGWVGDNIKNNFLEKIEDPVEPTEVREHKLLESARDPVIIPELGGDEKAEISFGQFWERLKTVDQRLWYVAYIRDVNDVLWAVRAYWRGDGLFVEARSLDYPYDWGAGGRFLSR